MRVVTTLLICFAVCLLEVSLADRTSRRRQPTTGAPAACPRRAPCNKDCGTRGFMRSENGCELCACNPAANCPALECPDSSGVCPFGWQEDENGCRLCECKLNPRCSGNRPMCMMFCADGFVNGADGCPTCQCYDRATISQLPAPAAAADSVASPTQLPARTRPGSRQHHAGGGRGRRNDTAPPSVSHHSAAGSSNETVTCGPICRMHCQYGFKLGAGGCPVCSCNDAPTAEVGHHRGGSDRRGGRTSPRRRGPQCQQQPQCAMYCPNGHRRDHNGCTLCECHQEGDATFTVNTGTNLQCQPLACHQTMRCAHGFATDQSSGCPMCVCKRSSRS